MMTVKEKKMIFDALDNLDSALIIAVKGEQSRALVIGECTDTTCVCDTLAEAMVDLFNEEREQETNHPILNVFVSKVCDIMMAEEKENTDMSLN